MVTSYLATEGVEFLAEIPSRCLMSTGEDGLHCRIAIHHLRSRKTGPCCRLVVANCRTHGVAFTLYPPGYVPYGRVAMAPVDTEGQELHEVSLVAAAPGGAGDDKTPGQLAWDATIFRAARDGGQGLAWPRRGSSHSPGSWRTQGRWIAVTAACLGLTSRDPDCWPLVGPLGVPALLMREASTAYRCAKGYVARGSAVTLPLSALAATGRRLLDLLLCTGFTAGCWGEAWRWDSRAHSLHQVTRLARPP